MHIIRTVIKGESDCCGIDETLRRMLHLKNDSDSDKVEGRGGDGVRRVTG